MALPFIPQNPLIVVCGHYGSGKTNVSVALALELKKSGKNVTLIDLDTVNPYFRAADSAELLKSNGIECINPEFANTNVDIPSLGAEVRSAFFKDFHSTNSVAIFDVGGDNGAAALGQYKRDFDRVGYDMLLVVNQYRPLTETPELAVEGMKDIEYYSRLKCTHAVNNSNLGIETTFETVVDSIEYFNVFCKLSGLRRAFTSVVKSDFSDDLIAKYPNENFFFIENSTKKLF